MSTNERARIDAEIRTMQLRHCRMKPQHWWHGWLLPDEEAA